jgi:hypothetical protein
MKTGGSVQLMPGSFTTLPNFLGLVGGPMPAAGRSSNLRLPASSE